MIVEESSPSCTKAGGDPGLMERVALAAASTMERGELLRKLLAELNGVVLFDSLGFFWREPGGGFQLTAVASSGRANADRLAVGAGPGGFGADLQAYCSRDNATSSHPVLRWLGRQGLGSSACVPVVVARQLVGWLVASREGSHPFLPEELRPLAQASTLVGGALLGIHLHERLEAAHGDLAAAKDEITRSERFTTQVELAYGVAHDINNILALIAARADLLQYQGLPTEALRSVEAIRQAVDDGVTVIRRITRFARDQYSPEMALLEVNRVVEDALEMTRPRWQPSPAATAPSIQVRFKPGPPSTVMGVASELREVMVNLIVNALDAMPSGGELRARIGREGEWAVVSVSDTGLGMTSEVQQRIFEPFFTTKGGGCGLGLWVSRGIVARHGGSIEVQSRPDRGTCFCVKLPVAVPASTPASQPPPSWKRSVLVVDDEAGLAEALKLSFQVAGYHAAASTDARQAVEAFKAGSFDLVITDLRMPGMTGWELAAEIKRIRPQVPVIAMTGWPVSMVAEGERAAVFETIVQKPCRVSDLQSRVRRLLSQHDA